MQKETTQNMPNRNMKDILAKTVKTGIIKSNLIPMFAGLTLALYTYGLNPLEKIPDILFSIIGTASVIASAGVFNNLYDRDIDAIMERTKNRPTVTEEIHPKTAMFLGCLLAVIGIGALFLATPLAALLGFIGLFFYIGPYTMWSKRKTVYNTEIGSISGAMPPLIGWAAMYPDVTHPAIIGLFIVMVIWQMPHFYSIAISKYDDYKAASVPMLPVVKGFKRTYRQTNFYLIILIATSFLFYTLSLGLTLVSLILGIIWLILNNSSSRKQDQQKWASSMFVYSLIYMTILFSTVIIYSIMGMIFG